MFTVEKQAGRLLEVRFAQTLTVAEATAFRSKLAGELVRAAGKVVICVDLTGCAPFDDTVKAMMLGVMRSDNPRVERAGYLTQATGANHAMVDEILGSLNSPVRRHFTFRPELAGWLGEVLDLAERDRLKAFLR